ncbi:hypothetical protein [Paenibacillus donghaensis]|nr:hypothetical protein [Paenibacillus donghaensis]
MNQSVKPQAFLNIAGSIPVPGEEGYSISDVAVSSAQAFPCGQQQEIMDS